MGLIDELARHLAGAAGQAYQGYAQGEQTKYNRQQDAQARQDVLQREALRQSLIEKQNAAQMEQALAIRDQNEAYRRDALQQQAQDREAARQQAAALQAERLQQAAQERERDRQARMDQARLVASLKQSGQPAAKPLPSSAVKDLNDWRALRDSAEDAKAAFASLDPGQNVTGGVAGRLAGVMGQFGIGTGAGGLNSPEAISARSKLANIATALGKLRSGGAITPQEYQRLTDLIPNKNEDESVVRNKLNDLFSYLDQTLNRNLDTYGEAGYRVDPIRSGTAQAGMPTQPDAPASSGAPSPQAMARAQALKAQGMGPDQVRATLKQEGLIP